MRCVSVAGEGGTRFASGADEKVIRVFHAPRSFVQTFRRIVLGEAVEDAEAAAGEFFFLFSLACSLHVSFFNILLIFLAPAALTYPVPPSLLQPRARRTERLCPLLGCLTRYSYGSL